MANLAVAAVVAPLRERQVEVVVVVEVELHVRQVESGVRQMKLHAMSVVVNASVVERLVEWEVESVRRHVACWPARP